MNQFLTKLKILLQSNYTYLLLIIFICFFIFINLLSSENKSKLIINDCYKGTIHNIIYDHNKEVYKLDILVNDELIIGRYYTDKKIKLSISDIVKVCGKTIEPMKNTIFNTFNYKKYLNNKRIYYLLKIDTIDIISKDSNLVYKVKNYMINRINNISNNSYLYAFIIGDKSNLEEYQLFNKNGIGHLFALSGMHISLLSGVLLKILKNFKYNYLIIIAFLIFYLFLTDFSASLLRSVVFFILLKINEKLDLNISNIKILLLTIIFIILFNYLIIFDIGFIYSSITTMGLLVSGKYFKKNYFYNLFLTSFFAFLFSIPITISLNYEINILSIFNNLLIVPLVSFIIYPLSLITFIFPFLSPINDLFIFILEKINIILNSFNLNIIIPKINILIFLFYYLLLGLFILSNKKKYLLFSILFIFALKLKPLITTSSILFFDVSQADCALLNIKRKLILIDTGGVYNYNYSDNIIKYIKSIGYFKVNTLIITHGDYDHMGEAINLVNNFRVEKVIFNCGSYNDLEQDLIKVLDKKKIPYYSCIKELNIDNNKLYFLNNKDYGNENDNSSVIYTELSSHKFLFMGDAGVEVEDDLIEKYNLQDIDVLKVGHHGSKTSSSKSFIDEINPKYGVISVGKNNRYGHPNKEVIDNLKNSKIYRTDQDGSIMFKIKNNKLRIDTCTP